MDTSTINALATDPWVTLGGFFTGILGVVLAIVFHVKSKKERLPFYMVISRTLIEGVGQTLEGLQLQYKGQPQSRITVTKVTLWNEGRETIDKSDIVAIEPVRVVCPQGIEILDIRVIQTSSPANTVVLGEASDVKHAPSTLLHDEGVFYPITFEYLDHKDYFVIQIVHNGDEGQRFSMKGKIKGVPEIERVTSWVPKLK